MAWMRNHRFQGDWHRYQELSISRRRLLLEALLSLFLARLILACTPFRRLAAWLGTVDSNSGTDLSTEQEHIAEDIAWAVRALARRVPWDSRCLAQAIAAYRMLFRRGIEATVYFGVKQNSKIAFDAHAWLRAGKIFVTGGDGHSEYQVLTRFSSKVQK